MVITPSVAPQPAGGPMPAMPPGWTPGQPIQAHAGGGTVSGPGGTDNVLAMLTAKEGVLTTRAMGNGGAELMTALNAGWVPPPDMLKAMLPGFVGGGQVSQKQLISFASGVEGQPYIWGGVNWGDCSGAVSAIANSCHRAARVRLPVPAPPARRASWRPAASAPAWARRDH